MGKAITTFVFIELRNSSFLGLKLAIPKSTTTRRFKTPKLSPPVFLKRSVARSQKYFFFFVSAVLALGLSGCSSDNNPLAPTENEMFTNEAGSQPSTMDLPTPSRIDQTGLAVVDFDKAESDTMHTKPVPEPQDMTWSHIKCLFR